jgi:hypothetical protein
MPMPCVPRQSGDVHNSAGKPASDRVHALFPDYLRYSVRATGLGGSSQCRLGFDVHPLGAAEHRSENRSKRASCLSESSASEIAS